MITFKEQEPIKTSTESQVEASAAPGETMSDADLRKERMAKNFAPEQKPDTPKKSGGSDGRINRAGRWAKANALLLAIIAVQGYTLAEVQAAKGYANSARWRASSAESAAENAEYQASSNGSKLNEIETSLQYGQYKVQCRNY